MWSTSQLQISKSTPTSPCQRPSKGSLFTKQRLHQQLFKMASRQGSSIKVEGPWRRASVWARGEFLLKTCIQLIFPIFSKDILHVAMWLKLPNSWRAEFSKNSWFAQKNLGFSLSFKIFFCSWFYITLPSMWPLRSKCEVFFIFFKNFYKVHSVELWSQDPHQQK
jgi:hypothetical protein